MKGSIKLYIKKVLVKFFTAYKLLNVVVLGENKNAFMDLSFQGHNNFLLGKVKLGKEIRLEFQSIL